MSKWVEGKVEMHCSLEMLKKAICNIMPNWADHIIASETPQTMYRYNGQVVEEEQGGGQRKANVIIPGGKRGPCDRSMDNDWGFAQTETGKWKAIYADYNLSGAQSMENKIKAEIAKLKTIQLATMNQYQITYHESNDEEEIIELKVDINNFKSFNI
jgi:hypothetical protein